MLVSPTTFFWALTLFSDWQEQAPGAAVLQPQQQELGEPWQGWNPVQGVQPLLHVQRVPRQARQEADQLEAEKVTLAQASASASDSALRGTEVWITW